jgi:hypothetical protein
MANEAVQSAPYICATVAQVRLTGDRMLLRPLKWEPSKILEVVRHGRPLRGEVMAVGPGHNPIKYRRGPKGPKQFMDYSRHFRATEVKPGDIVELGGLNVFDGFGYKFTEVLVGTEVMVLATERDVAIVVDDSQ